MSRTVPRKIRFGRRFPARANSIPFLAAAALCLVVALHTAGASSLASRPAQDADIDTDTIHFDSSGIPMDAFLARPKGAGQHPAVLVIHGEQGLDDSMRAIARQFAAAGFVALAPDLTSRLGGTRTPAQMAPAVRSTSPKPHAAGFARGVCISAKGRRRRSRADFLRRLWLGRLAKFHARCFGARVVPRGRLFRSHADAGIRRVARTRPRELRAIRFPHHRERDVDGKGHDGAGKKFTYYVYPGVGMPSTAKARNTTPRPPSWPGPGPWISCGGKKHAGKSLSRPPARGGEAPLRLPFPAHGCDPGH